MAKLRHYSLGIEFEALLLEQLQATGVPLTSPQKWAQDILKQSDYYIDHPLCETPWDEAWAQRAQLAYFLPLNYLRNRAVFDVFQNVTGLQKIESVADFGSGLGAGSFPFLLSQNLKNLTSIEHSKVAQALHRQLVQNSLFENCNKYWISADEGKPAQVAIFSYSFTELTKLPSLAEKSDYLIIIEPATQEDGRRLLEVRKKFLERGYKVLAPCTHQGQCPLLTQTPRDWCHDRIAITMPSWFQEIEKHLPIKNRTLTFSYLIVAHPKTKMTSPIGKARVIGDLLLEKGKARQMICRGENREFLSWMSRHGEPQEIPRGAVISAEIPGEQKAQELRISSPLAVEWP
jgi:hypothetical protein